MTRINFDKAQHVYYRDDGVIVPGVTEILEAVGIINKQWFTDQARIRGTYVHLATALWDRGHLVEQTLDPLLIPYLEAYKRFRHETEFTPQLIEQPVYNEQWGYAGTLDRWGIWEAHGATLLDLKSGYAPRWTWLQLAAYLMALGRPTELFLTLQLRDTGYYNTIEHKDMEGAFRQFLYALKTYQYINQEVKYYEQK